MRDEVIEREMWEAFARCSPNDETRHAVALRVIAREARNDPRAVAALTILASSTSDDVDAAFDRAVNRGSFATVDATQDALPPIVERPLLERITSRVRSVGSDLDELLQRVSAVFISPLVLVPATLSGDPERTRRGGTFNPDEEDQEDGDHMFRFPISEDLAQLGFGGRGNAELHAGILHVRVRKTVGADVPPIVVIAVADGKATDAKIMQAGTTVLTAELPWEYDGTPDEILLAVASQT